MCKQLAFREGREFHYENKGEPGKERKIFTPMGILRLEKRYVIPEEDRHKPEPVPGQETWKVRRRLPNRRLIEIENERGERGIMRVREDKQRNFLPGRPILRESIQEVTPRYTLAGTIWTRLPRPPKVRKFEHSCRRMPGRQGRYKVIQDGAMI